MRQKQSQNRDKPKNGKLRNNCHRNGHMKADCWSTGSGKENQGPPQRNTSKKVERKPTGVAAVAADRKLFAFTCTSDYANIVQGLSLPTTKLGGGIIDTGTSSHFCPDWTKFQNYCPLVG